MRELSHNPMLFCNPNSEISKKAKSLGFKVFECEMNKKNYHKTVPTLCKFIDENNINLVITHGSTDSWIGAITRLFKRKNKVKFIRERHNLFPINGLLSKFLHRYFFDKILYISQSVYDYLKSIKVSNELLFYMNDSVNVRELDGIQSTFRDEFNIPQNAIVIGTFTSLYRKKGVYDFADCVFEILKTHKDAYIVFGGGIKDDVKSKLLERFKGHKNIIFTGFRTDALNIIKAFNVYVFASHSEGLGTVLLEAMSSKTPIVVYDKEPMNTLITHNERGFCAKFLDTDSLTNCVLEILKDRQNAKNLAQNAFDFVSKNYDHKELKNRIKILLESL